jgi:dipeptidyl aminopeptidase/acylaminoacyl peptidase
VVPLIPRETLFGNPSKIAPRLSPDGRRLTWLAPVDGVLNVWIRTVGREDDAPLTRDRGRGIQSYFWALNNDRVLYVQDRDGDENHHLYSVPAAGGEPVDLTPHEGVKAQILAADYRFPDRVLVGLNDREPMLHDVYDIDVRTGVRSLAARNDLGAINWMADHDLRVRVAEVPTPDGGFRLLHRASPDDGWREIFTWGAEDSFSTGTVSFAPDGRRIYLASSTGSNTSALRLLDPDGGDQQTIASDPESDLCGSFIHPTTYEVQAVAFNRTRTRWQVLDPGIASDFAALARLHHGDFTVVDRDRADTTWLVAYEQDLGPTVYYAWDRASRNGAFMFSARPELEGRKLAAMEPVTLRARDGLRLHAYLTLPPGRDARGLPSVLNVHGGPWARDTWGYDPEAQWLANRGYACLQVNYRGSTGYGKDHINAADREWGGRMQDDLSDAVAWLVERGTADPARIAIYGGSYGGYAVLSGLTRTPDLFACGVDIVGPSNLVTWMNTIPPYWKPFEAILRRRVGDPATEEAFLKERSPLFHVDRIKVPLLIAQGKNDPRVKREESLQIRDALQRAGKRVEFVEFADEGHGFARPENRIRFYAMAEKFLAEHLGGRYEPDGGG